MTIQTLLDSLITLGVPGTFLYVEEADGSSRFYTAGYANLARQQRMSPDMTYHICSTTKTFTATVVLQLVAEGVLKLDHVLHDWLPELSFPNATTITLKHLLQMRSGLFDFESDSALTSEDELQEIENHLRPWTTQEVVTLAAKHEARFKPDEKFEYCNTNFCLLELIIEAATGTPLAEHFRQRIFVPLQLRATSYPGAHDLSLPTHHSRGYEFVSNEVRDVTEIFMGRGDGAMLSTTLDLARFFRALLTGKLLREDLLEQMLTVYPDASPAEKDYYKYGLGINTTKYGEQDVWGHSGGGFGQLHNSVFHPPTGRFVDFMANGWCKPKREERLYELEAELLALVFAS